MAYKYKHFIQQNIAPSDVSQIGIYNGDNRVGTVQLSNLAPVTKEKLYSFGIISDAHMGYNSYTNKNDPLTVGTKTDDGNGYGWLPNATLLRKALTYMSGKVSFCCSAGDFTNIGFYSKPNNVLTFYPYQMQEYYDVCALFPNIPMYSLIGNHENYYGASIPANTLTEDVTLPTGKTFTAGTSLLDIYEYYTGNRLTFTVEQGDDLFVFVGQTVGGSPMSTDSFNWLSSTLEENKTKRCFVFVHPFIDESWESSPTEKEDLIKDSGNACNARGNSIFGMQGHTYTTRFMSLMKQYKNTILFHGHSHMKFESQQYDKQATYTDANGFRSVHIPSLGDPRELTSADGTWVDDRFGGQFYIVDVYTDCIVLNGMYITKDEVTPIPLGVYKIDTTF